MIPKRRLLAALALFSPTADARGDDAGAAGVRRR